MSLDIKAQLDAAMQSYLDNAGYAEANSVSQAKSFVTACRKLLVLVPKSTGTRESQLEMSPDEIRRQLESAQSYVSSNDVGSGTARALVTKSDLRNFRD